MSHYSTKQLLLVLARIIELDHRYPVCPSIYAGIVECKIKSTR